MAEGNFNCIHTDVLCMKYIKLLFAGTCVG